MNAFTANLDAVALMALEDLQSGPGTYLPRGLFMKMLRTPGGIAPVTAESRKAARAAKAAKAAVKAQEAAVNAQEAAPARKPISDAQRKFYATYYARQRREQHQAA